MPYNHLKGGGGQSVSFTRSERENCSHPNERLPLRSTMDADLYDQLGTTITTDPHYQEQDDADIDNGEGSQEGSQGQSDTTRRQRATSVSLPQEIDQVVQAISSSPWAARLGDLMGTVRKQVSLFAHHCFWNSVLTPHVG